MRLNILHNMNKKRIISYAAALLLCLSLFVPAYAVVSKSDSFYVADYANVLDSDTEQTIIERNGALEAQCQGAQIVVVTVDYLDGMYSDEYAYQLFNNWGVGSQEYNNGMLLLLAVQENKAWLAYGLGLNSVLDTNTVDNMLDKYFWDDFDAGKYDDAVTSLFSALLKWYDTQYSSNVADAARKTSASQPQNYNGGYYSSSRSYNDGFIGGIRSIIRIGILVVVLIIILGGSNGRRRRSGGGSWLPWMLYFGSRMNNSRRWNDRPPHWDNDRRGGGGFGGFGGSGRGGGFGGFGGSGRGGGGFSGGGGGRR